MAMTCDVEWRIRSSRSLLSLVGSRTGGGGSDDTGVAVVTAAVIRGDDRFWRDEERTAAGRQCRAELLALLH